MPTGRYGMPPVGGHFKPIFRWVPAFSVDRCSQHDGGGVGPNGESYADARGYECAGCRWEPEQRLEPGAIPMVGGQIDREGIDLRMIPREAVYFFPAALNTDEDHCDCGAVDKSVGKSEVIHMSPRQHGKTSMIARALEAAIDLAAYDSSPAYAKGGIDDVRKRLTERAIDFGHLDGCAYLEESDLPCNCGSITRFPPEVYT